MKRMGCIVVLLLALLLPCRVSASDSGQEVGGIHILKTDVGGKPLEGAVFQILRRIPGGELPSPGTEKKILKIGEQNHLVEVQSFWHSREMEGQRQRQVTTDRAGEAAIYGLPYGTYYLVEVEAPQGYNRITDPIRLSIHRYSHLRARDNVRDDAGEVIDNTLHIINVRYTLPETGSPGWLWFTLGCAGILVSCLALVRLKQRRMRA